jgi:spore coat polysaccharide biosynthesis protein SpsF (cytidylyltransferase family)
VKLNIAKTEVITSSTKANMLTFSFVTYNSGTSCVKGRGAYVDSRLYSSACGCLFSHSIVRLNTDCCFPLFLTREFLALYISLIRMKHEHDSAVWNSLNNADNKKPECVRRTFSTDVTRDF